MLYVRQLPNNYNTEQQNLIGYSSFSWWAIRNKPHEHEKITMPLVNSPLCNHSYRKITKAWYSSFISNNNGKYKEGTSIQFSSDFSGKEFTSFSVSQIVIFILYSYMLFTNPNPETLISSGMLKIDVLAEDLSQTAHPTKRKKKKLPLFTSYNQISTKYFG